MYARRNEKSTRRHSPGHRPADDYTGAHRPPSLLFQARNFDVPLMVLVSGISFGIAYKNEPYGVYVWRRTKRLVFPVWLFLSTYFLVMHFTGYPVNLPDRKTIITSYLFLSGIGYVWVIRVFLLVALEAPFIFKLHCLIKRDSIYFLLLSASYACYEILLATDFSISGSVLDRCIGEIVFYAVPYGVIFAIGLRLPKLNRTSVLLFMGVMLVLFLICMTILWERQGLLVPTQQFKYPPRVYYLSYGLFAASFIWLCSDWASQVTEGVALGRLLGFLSRNSIWVYLWHIPFIEFIHLEFYVKFPLVVTAATSVTFLQVEFVNRLLIKNINSVKIKENVRTLLTG